MGEDKEKAVGRVGRIIEENLDEVIADITHLTLHSDQANLAVGRHKVKNGGKYNPSDVSELKEELRALWEVSELEYGPLGAYLKQVPEAKKAVIRKHLPEWREIESMMDLEDFDIRFKATLSENHSKWHKFYSQHVIRGINEDDRGHVLDYMLDKMGVDKKAVNYDLLKQNVNNVLAVYIESNRGERGDVVRKHLMEPYRRAQKR